MSLTDTALRVWIGIWSVADRNGVFEWRPRKWLFRFAPRSSEDAAAVFQQLVDAEFVACFESNGEAYGFCIKWAKHQDPHIHEAPQFPMPVGDPRFTPCIPRAWSKMNRKWMVDFYGLDPNARTGVDTSADTDTSTDTSTGASTGADTGISTSADPASPSSPSCPSSRSTFPPTPPPRGARDRKTRKAAAGPTMDPEQLRAAERRERLGPAPCPEDYEDDPFPPEDADCHCLVGANAAGESRGSKAG
jgi:hypothetical protein